MSAVIILILILGIAIGFITFILIKSFITPKKLATLDKFLKEGKTQSVIRGAKQMVAKDPKNAAAHYLLGLAYQAENKDELALIEYKNVNKIGQFGGYCPEKQFREKIASLYQKFNQPEEALKEYLLLLKQDPTNDELYYKAGELFEQRGKNDKAINYYRKTLEINQQHEFAHYKLGMLLYRAKKPTEAKEELEKSIRINPDNFKAYFFIGRILKENSDYAGALKAFEKAQRDPNQKMKALVERGICYMSMNNYDQAITELQRAVKISPDGSTSEALYARYFLGISYEKKRNIDKAVENWEKVHAKNPSFKDVSEKLSQYQDLRQDDYVKDYLTAGMEQFYEICKAIATSMNLNVREMSDIPNGCQIIAVESSKEWRGTKKMPKLLRFLRTPDLISESSVRSMYEDMKNLSITRGILFSSSNFSSKAQDFAENRPIELYDVDKLQKILKNISIYH